MQHNLQKIMSENSFQKLNELKAIELQPADLKSIFIHCTFDDQTMDKVQKFYPGQTVYVADLDMNQLEAGGFILTIEANPGGCHRQDARLQNKYPHLYHSSQKAEMIPKTAIKSITKIAQTN